MSFLTPLALGFLLILPLIYLAHMLRGSRRRLRVPSTCLWRDARVRARPGGGESARDAALALAASQLARTADAAGEIVLFTDGAFSPLASLGGLGAPVERVDVGGGAANQGIVSLQVRPEPLE